MVILDIPSFFVINFLNSARPLPPPPPPLSLSKELLDVALQQAC